MLKKPNQQASNTRKLVTPDEADRLASKLADKPYGDEERQDTATAISKLAQALPCPHRYCVCVKILLLQTSVAAVSQKMSALSFVLRWNYTSLVISNK